MKDRLVEVKEHYMEKFMGSPVAVDFELTFEEFLLLMLEGAEAANDALMEVSGMSEYFENLRAIGEENAETERNKNEKTKNTN